MCKNILIISSDFTGHGHKSITESLCEFLLDNKDVKVRVVDGFSLGGKALLSVGKSYGPITRTSKDLWKLIWDVSAINPALINEFIKIVITDNLLKLLREINPDLILSVHPNFNGSVIDILEQYKIDIPFITLIADLVSIYPLWADPRATYIISPTEEAKQKCMEYGVSESKIKVFGFPVRSRFLVSATGDNINNDYDPNTPLKCLIMSGGEGVGNMSEIAKILLDNFNCIVKIVAGRNTTLRKKLEQSLVTAYGNKVEIYGFTKNIQNLMLSSDVAFMRGSPNVMMEAISCNIPLIITGALPGQEEGNPEFAEKYSLGIVCNEIKDIKDTVGRLLENNAMKLNEIKRSQRNYVKSNAAKDIADFILSIDIDRNKTTIPHRNSKRFTFSNRNIWYKSPKIKLKRPIFKK
jgi:processive 1,2-diacylglycerol beta-glucosyltransferase